MSIFAAASTRDALQEIAHRFQAETGTAVELQTAASSILARQIAASGGADLFLSADERWADYLADRGLVEARRDLLGNHLVVIVPASDKRAIAQLADLAKPAGKRLALAGPQVPAGRYARQALKVAGIWDQLQDRVLNAANVRAALAYVAREEADAGLVYRTDALSSTQVRVALEVKDALHAPIRYPLVLIRRNSVTAKARDFYNYLRSEAAAAAFSRRGFEILG